MKEGRCGRLIAGATFAAPPLFASGHDCAAKRSRRIHKASGAAQAFRYCAIDNNRLLSYRNRMQPWVADRPAFASVGA
jgi:hypothetical protein